jgi:hypothetical protein
VIIRRMRQAAVAVAVLVPAGVTGPSAATGGTDSADDRETVSERLTGYQEASLAISTAGRGRLRVRIDEGRREISYLLSYSNLQGPVRQAHIHFGGPASSGGIGAFLCSNLGNGPVGPQTCPSAPAAISGGGEIRGQLVHDQ